MTKALQCPVLVGVGQVLQRVDDPLEGAEPLELMIHALGRAADDCGAPSLLSQAESVRVIRGVWRYGDPGREIARRLGLGAVETMGSPWGGNVAQACINHAAREIQSGERGVVLIAGAETGRSRALARRRGLELPASEAPGQPDRMLMPEVDMAHPAELARGVRRATDAYAIFESAVRAARGESLDEHSARIAELWSVFNSVACQNPNAWIRKPYSASQIGSAGPDNPMIALPYPRLMNANNRVDMGAGLILCSLAAAREAGVPEEKLVFLHAGTQANDSYTASERWDFHSSPAVRFAGRRALELARTSAEDVAHVDVYSCFPSAVQVAAGELGVATDRPLTVTGGLTFGGGPLNDYVLHSISRMVEVLREDRGARGLVTANGGLLSKHAFGVYSTEAPAEGFHFEDLQAQVDREPRRQAVVDWDGPVRIEGYTVAHEAGAPRKGYAACLTPDGVRTWAATESPELMSVMLSEEICGRSAHIDGQGGLDL